MEKVRFSADCSFKLASCDCVAFTYSHCAGQKNAFILHVNHIDSLKDTCLHEQSASVLSLNTNFEGYL